MPLSLFHKPSTATSWNSIVSTVHKRLECRKAAKVEKYATSLMAQEQKQVDKLNKNYLKSRVVQECHEMPACVKNKAAIAQAKSNAEQKCQQRRRRVIWQPKEEGSLAKQKRLLEVMRQKRLLEEMLVQHQKLERERRTIAMEILTMRNHVNEIRDKLDLSLQNLQNNPALSPRMPRPKSPRRNSQKRSTGFGVTFVPKAQVPTTARKPKRHIPFVPRWVF